MIVGTIQLGGLIVQRAYAGAGKFVAACLILFGFAAIGSLGANLGMTFGPALIAGSSQPVAQTPAEIVAARFPSQDATLPVMPASFVTSSVLPTERLELFSPSPSYRFVAVDPASRTVGEGTEQKAPNQISAAPSQPTTSQAAATKPEAPKSQPTNPAPRRVANRPNNVLNDAQIANIKRRLNLTPDQEQMWPAVETALRKIVYTKNAAEAAVHAAQSASGHMAYVDPGSAEVQQLKYAALPLIMRLNDDQRREVKMMAHVMGLEGVASQF
jgi:hypothetical protein